MSEPYEQKKGWSQEDFAFECRLHRNYIGPIERGERNISIENIKKISNIFRIDITELFKSLIYRTVKEIWWSQAESNR
ncbi:MAG: helix-turn-helix transcriptional regulator, partial [Pseudomonadota bacterium]|nr:helix-turn-helix transcriptional regulator [Pseudomonadota bacterium]